MTFISRFECQPLPTAHYREGLTPLLVNTPFDAVGVDVIVRPFQDGGKGMAGTGFCPPDVTNHVTKPKPGRAAR